MHACMVSYTCIYLAKYAHCVNSSMQNLHYVANFALSITYNTVTEL